MDQITYFHDTEQACSWLREVPWGGPLIRQLHADPRPGRAAKWLRTINSMYQLMRCAAEPGALAWMPDDEVDIAGWPALVAHLYD